jgi:hypothetical protein
MSSPQNVTAKNNFILPGCSAQIIFCRYQIRKDIIPERIMQQVKSRIIDYYNQISTIVSFT